MNSSFDQFQLSMRPIRSALTFITGAFLFFLLATATAGAFQQPEANNPTLKPTTDTQHSAPAPDLSPERPVVKHLDVESLKKKTKVPTTIKATKKRAEIITNKISAELPDDLEAEIKKYVGLRYRLGGSGRTGIDCSTLTRKVYADVFGIDLPRNSTGQSKTPLMDTVDDDDLQTGDLLFFGPKRKKVNHVGIYLAGGYFLHAAQTAGVTISRLDSNYWKSRWMLAKRLRDLPNGNAWINDQELNGFLEKFSLDLAFAGDTAPQNIHFLESGIQFNNTSELRLSAAYKQSLNQPFTAAASRSPLSLRQPFPVATESHLRLSAVLSPLPLQGFKLIPSITQIVDRQNYSHTQTKFQTLGLETWMTLPSSGVALFMGAQAKNQTDLLQRPLKMKPDWRTLDFSLGFHYRYSRTLGFSLLGIHSIETKPGLNLEQVRSNQWLDDISFKLDYRF